MRQDLCNGTVSIRPSVSSSYRPLHLQRVCCCGPGGQEISIDCCTAGARQQPRRSSTAASSKCEQCRVSSRCRRLNPDLLLTKTDRMVCAKSFLGRICKVIRRRGLGQRITEMPLWVPRFNGGRLYEYSFSKVGVFSKLFYNAVPLKKKFKTILCQVTIIDGGS